jgi:hypothetical protein
VGHRSKSACRAAISGKAVRYMLERWTGLTRFVDDPCIPLDNNAAERALRGPWSAGRITTARSRCAARRSPRSSTRSASRRSSPASIPHAYLLRARNTLNLKGVLDRGDYLLANLGGIAAPETQRLIGALLVNGIFHAAKQRDSRRRRDWFLICDEFGEFATRDFANSLDQLRKFGVHLVLAHQRLRQLEREDAEVLSAVMTNAKIKIVFGGLERSEVERIVRELFTGQARGDRIKHTTCQTKFRPILDTFEVESSSWLESGSEIQTDGWSRSESSGLVGGESETFGPDNDEWTSRSESRSEQSSSSSAEAGSRGRSTSRASGGSQSVVPITRHEEFREETSRQFWTLEEEWEQLIGLLHGLRKRQAFIKVYNRPVVHIRTPEVEPEKTDERLQRYREKAFNHCPHVKTVDAVIVEVEERRKELASLTEASETADRPYDVKTFRE